MTWQKTTLARHFAEGIDGAVQFAAFTGKAAKVMRQKGCEGATTLHRLIYDAETNEETGKTTFHLTNDPARQLRSLVLPGVEAPDEADQFLDEENDLLLRNGISTFDCLSDGSVTISRMITTYKKTTLDIADRAWLDIMVPVTMSRIRYDWSAYVGLMYPRSKLVDDESAGAFASRHDDDQDPGTAVVTPKRMAASWAARCSLYGEKVWIEDVQRTVRESVFERSTDDRNRLESRQQVEIVGNLMVFAGRIEFQV